MTFVQFIKYLLKTDDTLRVTLSGPPTRKSHGYVDVIEHVPTDDTLSAYRIRNTKFSFYVNQPKRLVNLTQATADMIRAYYAFRGYRVSAITVHEKEGPKRYPMGQFRHTVK